MSRQLRPALVCLGVATLLLGIVYPLLVWGVGGTIFSAKSNGSLVSYEGKVVGSALIGQEFTGREWFHGRPTASAAASSKSQSGATNFGPSNEALATLVDQRARTYRVENGVANGIRIPADAVTASGSGLDPAISIANARLQAPRVARERGLELGRVLAAIDVATAARPLGALGDPGVNVLRLNLALARIDVPAGETP